MRVNKNTGIFRVLIVAGLLTGVIFAASHLLTVWVSGIDEQKRLDQNLSEQNKCDSLLLSATLSADAIATDFANCSPELVAALKTLQNTKLQANLSAGTVDGVKLVGDALKDNATEQQETNNALSEVTNSLKQQNQGVAQFLRENPTCDATTWQNSEDVVFTGCDSLLAGDVNQWEWKTWEDALRDGDLCVHHDELSGRKVAEIC